MMRFKSSFLQQAFDRGFIHQGTDLEAFDSRLCEGSVVAYIGYDATADSLHVGSLLTIMLLRLFQKCGHRPLILMGGGTTRIGDPSGKDMARQALDKITIDRNIQGIQKIFARYLDFSESSTGARIVNNADWLDNISYLSFLEHYGRHFTINRMLTFDSVQLRLQREQPLTFLEFNYMILQAYDFLELSRRYKCVAQFGGSDQWGNIVNGVELGRRVDQKTLYGVTTPLLTTSDGAKMGKTAQGAIWLNQERLPDFEFWQYWRNCQDADLGRFFRLFTELPLVEIEALEKLTGAECNHAKKILADEVTSLARGKESLNAIHQTVAELFEGKSGSLESLPTLTLTSDELKVGLPVYELLHRLGLTASNNEGKRLIRGRGVRLNDQTITDESQQLERGDFAENGTVKLSAGKKRHGLVILNHASC